MKRAFKNRLSKSEHFNFWLVTITIFLIGFLFVFLFIFNIFTQRCVSFQDFWLESKPSLFFNFAWIFGLLFVWNMILFVSQPFAGRVNKGKAAHFFINATVMLVIGLALLRLHEFIIEYEAIYELSDAEWNVSEGVLASSNDCRVAKPYLGRWAVSVLESDRGPDFPYDELILDGDLTFKLRQGGDMAVHNGRWGPPVYHWLDLSFYYHNADQHRSFEVIQLERERMLLKQTWAYVGGVEIDKPVKIELLRLPQLEKPESAFDINWDFIFDRKENISE